MIRRVVLGVTVAGTMLLAVGCQGEPARQHQASQQPDEIVATKSELLRDAMRVYENYLAAVERISERGNRGFDELHPYSTDAAFRAEIDSFKALDERGLHTVGSTKLLKFEPQQVDVAAGSVVAYACVDLSDVKVLNSAGDDATPEDRPDRQTSLPRFETKNGSIRLAENGTWSGDSVC